ncbi:hypothetical protein MKX01_021792 [Papaver californicum]|nr:hypothetical protein MKX01_021792 [Papaver californicum]
MASSCCFKKISFSSSYIIPIFVAVLLIVISSSIRPVDSTTNSSEIDENHRRVNQSFRSDKELQRLKRIRAHLAKINKPALKTIQSSDGDLIDCVPIDQQPAFDHPELKGQTPLDPPERPKDYETKNSTSRDNSDDEIIQLWSSNGESCPIGTIPIRRTKEEDISRASSIVTYGRKTKPIRRDTSSSGHEHAVGYVTGKQYFGAKASLNVWSPKVTNMYEFSLSQIWVISGTFGNDLNTIEAGWQVSPQLYGDSHPRFFTYWTTDAYQTTGCYNLLCTGFVQTHARIAVGAAIAPISSYNGRQFDISILVWKDPKRGHWWLQYGSALVGYWPSFLFSHLRNHASMVQFGGEIVDSRTSGFHTSTQMGSGHFATEGFGKASYFRNIQVVDWDNNLIPPPNFRALTDHSSCYDIRGGNNRGWGIYFYYGGPGRNIKCP